jgi:3-phosphoshikimate 1-carboxyvinyltransferase
MRYHGIITRDHYESFFWKLAMRLRIRKTESLHGVITPPGSKSEAVRALIFAMLSPGESMISNLPPGDDLRHAITVCREMGCEIFQTGDLLRLRSLGLPLAPLSKTIYTGNSGITTRFLLPLLGLREDTQTPIRLNCGEQMRARPMAPLIDALKNLGLEINCLGQADALPIEVRGNLTGGKTRVSGISSQYLSSLLIALPLAPQASEIRVHDLHERPYVDLTLAWLRRQGIRFEHRQEGLEEIFMIPGGQQYFAMNTFIPGDFSSASYFIAAGALFPGEIVIEGLNLNDAQGDKQLIDILRAMGAEILSESSRLIVRGGRSLKGIAIDAKEIPDLLPTLAVIGTVAEGRTEIYNVPQARLKETDRIHSMTQGLRALGASIQEKPDGMILESSSLTGGIVKGYGDHRTVMALTLAGMLAEGETQIDEAESINKTYPGFIGEMQKLGGDLIHEGD